MCGQLLIVKDPICQEQQKLFSRLERKILRTDIVDYLCTDKDHDEVYDDDDDEARHGDSTFPGESRGRQSCTEGKSCKPPAEENGSEEVFIGPDQPAAFPRKPVEGKGHSRNDAEDSRHDRYKDPNFRRNWPVHSLLLSLVGNIQHHSVVAVYLQGYASLEIAGKRLCDSDLLLVLASFVGSPLKRERSRNWFHTPDFGLRNDRSKIPQCPFVFTKREEYILHRKVTCILYRQVVVWLLGGFL